MLPQNHDLDMTPNGVPIVVNVSQYDVGREINFYLYNGSEVYTPAVGALIRIEGTKPDNTGFSYNATFIGNKVTMVLTEQMTVLEGAIRCELRVTEGGSDVGSLNFILQVEKAALRSDIPISDTEIPAIIELARAEQYNAEAWAVGQRNGQDVPPTDPTYHNNAKYWSENTQHGSLDALADVEITTPSDGQALLYDADNDEWVNGEVSAVASLDDLTDTDITTPTNGQVLSYDDVNGKWVNDDLPNIPDELSDLSDVNFASPSNGQVMTYNGTSQKWENKDIPSDTVTQAIISPVEGATSLHAYAVGKQLIYNDTLYKVIAPIAVNDALVVDTNIEVSPKTVIEQVEDNASEIDDLWDAQQTLGAWNLLETTLVTQVKDSVTWTANADGTVNANGTTSADSRITIGKGNLSEGTYYLSGCATPPNTNDYRLRLSRTVGGVETVYWNDDATSITTVTVTSAYAGEWVLEVRYGNTKVMNDALFKPMIAIKAGLPRVPHAKTNRQLTKGAAKTASITIDGTVVKTDRASHVYYDLINRTCTFDLQLTVGTYANYSNFVTGLPRPKSANIFPCVCLNNSRNIGIATLTDSGTTGQMYFTGLSTAPNFATNDQVTITGSYIISDAVTA